MKLAVWTLNSKQAPRFWSYGQSAAAASKLQNHAEFRLRLNPAINQAYLLIFLIKPVSLTLLTTRLWNHLVAGPAVTKLHSEYFWSRNPKLRRFLKLSKKVRKRFKLNSLVPETCSIKNLNCFLSFQNCKHFPRLAMWALRPVVNRRTTFSFQSNSL